MTDAAATISNATETQAKIPHLAFLLQVSRPGLWTTTAMFYLMPLGHSNFLYSAVFWVGLFFVLFPLGLLLYGVNDIVDAEADRINPRKGTFLFGSRGGAEQLAALRWEIGLAVVPFFVLFYFLVGPRILGWIAALLLAVGMYNAPRIGLKGRPPFDVLIQASYLLVFVLSSWLNHAPQLPWQTFLFGALFAMHSHIFGEVMDIEPDSLSGRRTTATFIGRQPAKVLIAGLLCVESALVFVFFGDFLVAGFLALGVLWFFLDATLLWKNSAYSPATMRLFMWAWNATAVLGMIWNWSKGTFTHVISPLAR